MITPELVGLRRMRRDEARLLAEWEKLERPYPWTENQFLETLNSNTQQTLLWDENESLVGFAVVQIVEDEAYLLNIMVKPERRRQGQGAKLMGKVLAWIRDSGAHTLFLDVDPKNSDAFHLYQKTGFDVVGRRVNAYPRGEESVLMRKKIT